MRRPASRRVFGAERRRSGVPPESSLSMTWTNDDERARGARGDSGPPRRIDQEDDHPRTVLGERPRRRPSSFQNRECAVDAMHLTSAADGSSDNSSSLRSTAVTALVLEATGYPQLGGGVPSRTCWGADSGYRRDRLLLSTPRRPRVLSRASAGWPCFGAFATSSARFVTSDNATLQPPPRPFGASDPLPRDTETADPRPQPRNTW